MARVILGVTGSVAAIRTPTLWHTLLAAGHRARVVATGPATYFFDPALISRPGEEAGPGSGQSLFTDRDEWPKERYERGDDVPHIEFRKWADILIVAPLDANTLAKFALGLSDNFLTCIYRAWDFQKPVILAPAMNTLMWQSLVTLRHLRQIFADRHPDAIAEEWSLESAASLFAKYVPRVVLVPPQAKTLACGDVGVGAMAEVVEIAEAVRRWSLDPLEAVYAAMNAD
jgi:phosphopantothenoylcysteine decarboxylase